MPIEKAPARIRREHYLRERRNSRIAVLVIVVVLGIVGWAGYRLGLAPG